MNDLIFQLAAPHPASSLFFAHRAAHRTHRTALRALYTLHKKWREAAVYTDQHQAVTTLNWWHHELEKAKVGDISHPALIALKPWLVESTRSEAFFLSLQGLLHGHMHWHHITRIADLEQLEPIIDTIGSSFALVWLHIVGLPELEEYALKAGRAIWWIDQTRHIGHGLTPSRLWIPMSWLKELNLPAHLILKTDLNGDQRATHGSLLVGKLLEQSHQALDACIEQQKQLNPIEHKLGRSLHALIKMRAQLLREISLNPDEVWHGIVSVAPRKKWWASICM